LTEVLDPDRIVIRHPEPGDAEALHRIFSGAGR
jgi:hypothetical protein